MTGIRFGEIYRLSRYSRDGCELSNREDQLALLWRYREAHRNPATATGLDVGLLPVGLDINSENDTVGNSMTSMLVFANGAHNDFDWFTDQLERVKKAMRRRDFAEVDRLEAGMEGKWGSAEAVELAEDSSKSGKAAYRLNQLS